MNHFVFDVESIGLHGEAFAVGYVVMDDKLAVVEEGMFACDPYSARGTAHNHSWVTERAGLKSVDVECASPGVVREMFWQVYGKWKAKPGTLFWADCAWPVEARFLIACVEDAHTERQWDGPYPLHDIATLMYAKGIDPLSKQGRLPEELPEHHPLKDARQSARILATMLRKD